MPPEEQRCIKCGRPVAADETLCRICNRAAMATPSATQYHGTIVVAIIVAVLALAIGGSLALRGVGPYRAALVSFADSPAGGLEVTLEVVNEGSRGGRAKCQIVAIDQAGRRMGARSAISPTVDAGARVVFVEQLPAVSETPARVAVECS